MRRFPTIPLAASLPVLLTVAVLGAACDDDGSSARPQRLTSAEPTPARRAVTTTVAPAPPAPTTTAPAPTTAPATAPPPPTTAGVLPASEEPEPGCSDGGTAEAQALQASYDEGHQPWRGDPEWVARVGAACLFGDPADSVEPAGDNRYLATDAATGAHAIVDVAQPLGPGTVWLATHVAPT